MGMNKYTSIPHPFVIEPPLETDRTYEPGEEISFGLILIGKVIDYLPYFVYTFEEMGKIGIGKKRGKYRLLNAETEDNSLVYSCEDRTIQPQSGDTPLTISFLTPTRISYGRDLAVNPDFHILVRSLLRRVNLLNYFHGEKREAGWNHREIIAKAEAVNIEKNNTRWWDWERYSARQGVRMKMGGLVGEVKYEGNIEPFISLLQAGVIFHVGKGTSFGLGKYEIQFGDGTSATSKAKSKT
jgi:CRISPR-associated endoribonuclease Cas6